MANYYTQFAAYMRIGKDNIKLARDLMLEMANAEEIAPAFELRVDDDENTIYLDDDGVGNYDDVINFARELFKRIGGKVVLPDALDATRWGFEWANICDKPRRNAFGGGAWAIDLITGAERIISTSNFLHDALSAEVLEANMTHEGLGAEAGV